MIATTAPAKPANIMEALTREIERVAVIRERYALLGGMPGTDIPALTQDITRALWAAHEAVVNSKNMPVVAAARRASYVGNVMLQHIKQTYNGRPRLSLPASRQHRLRQGKSRSTEPMAENCTCGDFVGEDPFCVEHGYRRGEASPPAAGPGTCWHWWDGCPKANKRGCYLPHTGEQDELQEVSR